MDKSIEERVQETRDRFDRVFGKSSDQPNNDHTNGMHSRQNKEDQDVPRKTSPFPEDIQRRAKSTSERVDRFFARAARLTEHAPANSHRRTPSNGLSWDDIPLDEEDSFMDAHSIDYGNLTHPAFN